MALMKASDPAHHFSVKSVHVHVAIVAVTACSGSPHNVLHFLVQAWCDNKYTGAAEYRLGRPSFIGNLASAVNGTPTPNTLAIVKPLSKIR